MGIVEGNHYLMYAINKGAYKPAHVRNLINDVVLRSLENIAVNTFEPNGISHIYQLDQSISVLRDVG